jgi:hypothetical protein
MRTNLSNNSEGTVMAAGWRFISRVRFVLILLKNSKILNQAKPPVF